MKSKFMCMVGGGFIAGVLPMELKAVSVHMTYDEGGCSEKCKASFQALFGESFSPGDWGTGLISQSGWEETGSMPWQLLFEPSNRVIVDTSLTATVARRIEACASLPRYNERLAAELLECAKWIDSYRERGLMLKMYSEKTSLLNLLVLSVFERTGQDLRKAVCYLNDLLGRGSGAFAMPLGIEDCNLSFHLLDGNVINGQHQITMNRAAYTAKPDYLTVTRKDNGQPPQGWDMPREAIAGTQTAFVLGGGSVFDSLLPHLLTGDYARLLTARVSEGIRSVFIVKSMREVQTHNLSLREIMEVFERSVKRVLPSFTMEQAVTDVILPSIPASILNDYRDIAEAEFARYLKNPSALNGRALHEIGQIMQDASQYSQETVDLIRKGVVKPAKLGSCVPMDFTAEDEEYLAFKGIRVHRCRSFIIREKALNYDPKVLAKMIKSLKKNLSIVLCK